MSKLLILGWKADKHIGFFSDLYDNQRVIVRYIEYRHIPSFLSLLRKIYLSSRLMVRGIYLPYRHIWFCKDWYQYLETVDTILLTNGVLDKIDYKVLDSCKKRGAKIDLFMLDALDANSGILRGRRHWIFQPLWSHIFSFEPNDVRNYGFEYLGFCYYSVDKSIQGHGNTEIDLYFSGNTKGGRSRYVNQIYKYLASKDAILRFDVQLHDTNEEVEDGINCINNWIPYREILLNISKSKCILEILQRNQTGPSLRYFEAVCYNKKLITNNPYIVEFPYYNSQWMKIITKADDIDVDWL